MIFATQELAPPHPIFTKKLLICKEISYSYSVEHYEYAGLVMTDGRIFLTNEPSYAILNEKLHKECGNNLGQGRYNGQK